MTGSNDLIMSGCRWRQQSRITHLPPTAGRGALAPFLAGAALKVLEDGEGQARARADGERRARAREAGHCALRWSSRFFFFRAVGFFSSRLP